MGRVASAPFKIKTDGGMVESTVHPGGAMVTVEMGRVSFDAAKIPVPSVTGEALNQTLTLTGETLIYNAATIGNPHCVLLRDTISESEARRLGPGLETHPNFPNRTNVQFLKVLDRNNIQIEIWERGAGYTLASGSSSSAAAAVARRLGLVDANVIVHMPGGQLKIQIADDYAITMTGPVTRVADGEIHPQIFE
jgi:diaminopimelate epimerase